MDAEFSFPCSFKDLAVNRNEEFYVEVLSDKDIILSKFQEYKDSYDTNLLENFVSNFNVFYSAIEHFSKFDRADLIEIWHSLILVNSNVYHEIVNLLDADAECSVYSKQSLRNIFSMNMFLLIHLALEFENDEPQKRAKVQLSEEMKDGGKGKRAVQNVDLWKEENQAFLELCCRVLSLDLKKLWAPALVDERLIDGIGEFCQKMLHPWIASRKQSLLKAFDLLIHTYNHGITFAVQLIQSLAAADTTPEKIAEMVSNLANNDSETFLVEILKELSQVDAAALSNEGASAKNYSVFLVDIARLIPDCLLRNISLLVPFLTEDSFAFRNGVLTAFSVLISNKLTGEDLPESLVTLRTQFFKHLLEHIHDINGHVRCKALQLFTKLVLEKCVPLNEYKLLMPLAIGRLADKLPTVRKAAIQLLSNILNNNPFMKKVTIEELQNRLETEKKNLANLIHSNLTRIKGNKESEVQDFVNEKWAVARNRMSDILDELIEKYWEDGNLNLPDELCNFDEVSDVISKSAFDCMVDGNYRETVLRFINFGKLHPDSALLASVFDTHSTSAEFKRNLIEAIKFVFCDLIMASEIAERPLVDEVREKVMKGDQVQRQKIFIRFIEDSLCFLQQVHSILPLITEMLYQNQLSDVLESIDFLVNCVSHGVSSNNETIWRCFELVWSAQEAVRNGALKAFQKLCIDINSEFNESYIIEMRIQRLLAIMQKASASQYFTLTKLISLALKKGILDNFSLMPAWDIIQNNKDTLERKKIALRIICMFAVNDRNVLRGNIKRLLVFGLSENCDFHSTYLVLRTLSKLGWCDRQSNLKFLEEIACEVEECSLFCRVMRFLLDGITNYDDNCWIAAMEYGIRLIFYAARNPDVICASFLRSLCAKSEEESKKKTYPLFLARVLSAIGQVSYCSFHFLDLSFLNQLKKSRNTNEQVNNSEKKAVDSVFGLDTVASLEDRDRDFVNKICEEYILRDGTFLGEYSKFVIKICKQPIKYNYAPLQAVAAETLMKLMFISQKFCAENCRLLVTMLEKSKFPVVRRTIMTLLPDLYARHPNEIEYWTKRIHSRIFDENLSVRVCSISIMSYLVLHNLTKPGRMLADIAICTVDENDTIVSLAKRFFKEYSDKTTTFYSILPDISGQLSLKYNEIGAEKSLEICKFLYSFISKERQNESFVDRLCERFVVAKNLEHCHILAKCLTLPSYNERLIRKVAENMKCYEDKLKDDTVLKCFLSVVDSARRNWKSDGKERLDMLQAEFKEKHEKYKATEIHFAPDHSVLNAEEPAVVEASSDPTENVGQAYVNKLRLSLHHQMDSAEWSFLRTICPDLDDTIADTDLNGKDDTDMQLKTAIEDCEIDADTQKSSDELVNNDKTKDNDGHLSVTTDLNSAKTKAAASGKRTPGRRYLFTDVFIIFTFMWFDFAGRPRKRLAIDDDSSSVSKRADDDQRSDGSTGKEITSQSVLRTDNSKEKKSSLEKRKATKNASKKSQAPAADRVVNLTESSDDEPAMTKSKKTSMKTDRKSIDTEKSNVAEQQSTSTPKDSTSKKKGKHRRCFIQELSSESDDAKEDNFFAYLTKFNIKTPLGSSKALEVDENTAERRAEKKKKKKKEEDEKRKMKGILLSSDDDDSNIEETPVTKSSISMKRQKGKKKASSESEQEEEEEEVSVMRTRLSTLRSRQLKADRNKKEKRKLKTVENASSMQIDSSSSDSENELSNNYKLRSGAAQRGKKLDDSKAESKETTKSSSFLRPNIMNWDDITNSMNRSTRSRRESSGNITSSNGNSRTSNSSSISDDDDDDDGKIKMLNTTSSQRRSILKNFRKAREGGHISRKTLFEMSQRSSSAYVKNSSDDEQQQSSSGVFSEKKRSTELRNAKRKRNAKAVGEEVEEYKSTKLKKKKTEKNTGRSGASGKLKNTAATSTKSENKNDSRKRKAGFNLFESDNEDESVHSDSISDKSKFKNISSSYSSSSYTTRSRQVSFRKNVKAKRSSDEEGKDDDDDDDDGNTSSDVVEPKKKVYKRSELPSSSSKAKQSKKISGQQQMKKSNANNSKQKGNDAEEASTSLTYSLRSSRKQNYKL
ncbi:Condensin complex subunit 1 [Trichinella pseudospiralis]|uniref:Condensin complex subunit 1 n=1 Tax=Trichinella pseudospiralis TaxID=6337 RepID=A0A0V1K574_TRIPS|nr:Condensin complex subunit 1 [Trichinella pseudospiralis]